MTALRIEDLVVTIGDTNPVDGVSLTVEPGEIVALVGESGSGKSMTAMSVMGLLPPLARRTGSIQIDQTTVDDSTARQLRGRRVAMVFQEPMTALNPAFTVGWQVAEALRVHDRSLKKGAAIARAAELLELAGIPEPRQRLGQFPHELSGGLRQRVMIAMAIACDPAVLIADEATTALDVTVQAEILDLLRSIRDRLGTAILVITHNMGVVADIADRVVVMRDGRVVEEATVGGLFYQPKAEYTRTLLDAVPRLEPRGDLEEEQTVVKNTLECDNLSVKYGAHTAVEGVDLAIAPGEILGLVGESGSGKSTVARCTLGLLTPSAGTVRVHGEDLSAARGKRLRRLRQRSGSVFQDPGSSLDPRMTIGECVAEPMIIAGVGDRPARVAGLLESVRLDPGLSSRYPHQLSGGQRQRVSIARALALSPELVVADEPTSALDVSVQATVLDLLLELQASLGFACLFISHDLAVVSSLAHRVAVMRSGRLVESGSLNRVLFAPAEAYTKQLVAATPVPDPDEQRRRRQARLAMRG
jgi:peptide/nickel transport system ATP-binding protein